MTNLVRSSEDDIVGLVLTLADGSRAVVETVALIDATGTEYGSANPQYVRLRDPLSGFNFGIIVPSTATFNPGGNGAMIVASVTYGIDSSGQAARIGGEANGLVVQPALSGTFWQSAAAAGGIVSSTADVVLKTAAGAGVRNVLSSIQIAHDVLSAVTEFVIKDGATIIHRGKLQTPAVDSALGAGTIKFDPPLRGTANTALNFALLTSVTGGVFVNAQGFTGA